MDGLTERLKHVASRHTLRLTHYGRKSGKQYQVTIWFVVSGQTIYLATANANRQWVRNVKKTPNVRLSIAGETFEGQVQCLDEPADRDRIMQLFVRKYWMFLPAFLFGRILTGLGAIKNNTGAFEVTLNG
ncbi:MAG TPA: nitroreductase family deazaflavin-dependent oxidoreductase [Blastocatellia bacterium]